MADNTTITAGVGTTIAADDVSGVLYPRVKLVTGADGAADGDLDLGQKAAASSLSVVLASDADFVKAEDAGHSSGDKGIMLLTVRQDTAAALGGTDADYQPLITDANGKLHTSTTLAAGTAAIGKLAANSGVDIGDVDVTSIVMPTGANAAPVQGTVAHDSAAANNPVLLGAKAVSSEPAAVANADVAMLLTDLVGKLITLPYANPENFVKGATAVITDTTRTAVIAAQGAGVKLYITQILVTNSDATVGTVVNIEDDTTTIYSGYAAAAGGGFSCTFPVPLVITANKALNASCVTTSSETRVSASGYKGA